MYSQMYISIGLTVSEISVNKQRTGKQTQFLKIFVLDSVTLMNAPNNIFFHLSSMYGLGVLVFFIYKDYIF